MQFGSFEPDAGTWSYRYPHLLENRFERRLSNGPFIAEKVREVAHDFTHVIFVHISMQFGLLDRPLPDGTEVWTFPMFLTPSYRASGECVSDAYFAAERAALLHSTHILTPSHLEKNQLISLYGVPEKKVRVVPRGVDLGSFVPQVRKLSGPPRFCSIGSVKPQKNTLGLVRLFSAVREQFPGATLQIIGPDQNSDYSAAVREEINWLGLADSVDLMGYVPPNELSDATSQAHLHLSVSSCETFGRSIFETLASGLPNVAMKQDNAAAHYLADRPYVHFVENHEQAVASVEEMLAQLPQLSSMAIEVGHLFDDEILSRLLVAEVGAKDPMVVSDFDGTLFHKDDSGRTERSMDAFRSYPQRVICSARSIHDLSEQVDLHNLSADWLVGYSGAVIADQAGRVVWCAAFDANTLSRLERAIPDARRIEAEGRVIQLAAPASSVPIFSGARVECYQGTAFIAPWEASKLRAVCWLLCHIGWKGRVRAFGDGPYDEEFLTFFDGTKISKMEVIDECVAL
jgi:glycosyltransferase involved in cell wall biosynthesis